jgi:hypothetical protein
MRPKGKVSAFARCNNHYFCSMCVMADIDFMTIATWFGHKDGGILVGKAYAAIVEVLVLALYLWWVSGHGPPRSTRNTRGIAFRSRTLSPAQ